MTYSTPALLVRAGQGVFFCFFFFFFLGALGSPEAPMDIAEALTDTSGAKPEASNISFLASSCASSSFFWALAPGSPTHLSQLTSGPAPACTSSPTPFQPYQPPVPGSPTDDKDLSCLQTSPLPVSWRQWQWQNRQDHPRPQGKGNGQALGRELAQGEDLLNFARNLSSWACPTSSYWDSFTCNPHRTSWWLQDHYYFLWGLWYKILRYGWGWAPLTGNPYSTHTRNYVN